MAIPDKAFTRGEQYLAAMAGQSGTLPDAPITRKERYLAKAAGQAVETPEPITREEMYLDAIARGGGGGEAVLVNKTVSANGTYLPSADSADGYKKVVVNVPTPTPALTTKTITANGTYAASSDNADGYSEVTVDVPSTPPTNVTVLYNNISSSTIALYPFVYNSTLDAIVGQAPTSVTGGNATSKSTAIQGNHIVIGVNVSITGVTYNGSPLPYSNLGSGATRFTVIELPEDYDPAVAIGLNRS